MSLNFDAMPCSSILNYNLSEEKLNREILLKIEDDLDIDEKVSILFLMTNDYSNAFREIYDLLQKHREHKTYVLDEFINIHSSNWKNMLLESLGVIQNKKVIRKLRIPFEDFDNFYLSKHRLCSRYLNRIGKRLYLLCEALSEDRIQYLLKYVRNDLTRYDENLKDISFLELHILYWIQENYISVHSDGTIRLENLLKHLQRFEDLQIILEDLKKFENHSDVLDCQFTNSVNIEQSKTFSVEEVIDEQQNTNKDDLKTLNKGLCIIISQMLFAGGKYETRFGTTTDCTKLSETFNGFGFTVQIYNNLKEDEIYKTLKDIPHNFGTDYNCIFVCILSHGCKGGIISSDEKEISIEDIEYKFCCTELKDVVKILIVQACQGKVTGQANVKENLAIDGPIDRSVSSISAYKNFCIFMSTMQGFVSIRDKQQGSWFIQEFCKILQNSRTTFLGIVSKTIQSVMERTGNLDGIDSVSQLPELRTSRLLSDFYLPKYGAHR